jgi:hypothetical protein
MTNAGSTLIIFRARLYYQQIDVVHAVQQRHDHGVQSDGGTHGQDDGVEGLGDFVSKDQLRVQGSVAVVGAGDRQPLPADLFRSGWARRPPK